MQILTLIPPAGPADPPSCTVGEPRSAYRGEHSFPLILQNVHRYFFYVAIVFLFILSYDVWLALWFVDPATRMIAPHAMANSSRVRVRMVVKARATGQNCDWPLP